jgi:hypothetical protein
MGRRRVTVCSALLLACLIPAASADPLLSPGALLGVITNPTSILDTSGGTPAITVPTVISVAPSLGDGGTPGAGVGLLGGGGETIGGGGVGVTLPGLDSTPEHPVESPVASTSVGISAETGGGSGPLGGVSVDLKGNGSLGQQLRIGANGNLAVQASGGSDALGNNAEPVSMGGGSSRLRTLLAVIEGRDWLALVEGNALCLSGFGAADVGGWLPANDLDLLDDVVARYRGDIALLQKMISNCRSNRSVISRSDIKRVIGLDIRNGQPVLFML